MSWIFTVVGPAGKICDEVDATEAAAHLRAEVERVLRYLDRGALPPDWEAPLQEQLAAEVPPQRTPLQIVVRHERTRDLMRIANAANKAKNQADTKAKRDAHRKQRSRGRPVIPEPVPPEPDPDAIRRTLRAADLRRQAARLVACELEVQAHPELADQAAALRREADALQGGSLPATPLRRATARTQVVHRRRGDGDEGKGRGGGRR